MSEKTPEQLQKEVEKLEKKLNEKNQKKEYEKDIKIGIESELREKFKEKYSKSLDITETKFYFYRQTIKEEIIKEIIELFKTNNGITTSEIELYTNKMYIKTLLQVHDEFLKNGLYLQYTQEKEEKARQQLIEEKKQQKRLKEQQQTEYIRKLEINQAKFITIIPMIFSLIISIIIFYLIYTYVFKPLDFAINESKKTKEEQTQYNIIQK